MYALRESLSGFNRTKIATLGSITTIMISLMFLGFFYVIASNMSRLVGNIQEKVEMEAFLEDPLSPQSIGEIERQILAVEGVERVRFISKEEAAAIFKNEFGEDINAVLDYNPLPASFKIYVKKEYLTPEKVEEIHEKVMVIKGIESDVFRRDMLRFIEEKSKTLSMVGLGLGMLIAISAIFLVSNTIRMAIDAKRKTVQTMKLVGASRWFIRAPFILEGIIQGILGGLLAALLMYYLLTFAAGTISADLAEFLRIDFSFYGLIVLNGFLLGLLGSLLSVRRFIGETVAG
jgi:cell division transport system permease protein